MDKTSVVTFIVRLVSEAQPSPITGGQLASRVKAFYPEFNPIQFGSKNTREFIKNHIPEVTERGNAGMDVLYGLRAQQAELFSKPASERQFSHDRGTPLGQLKTNPRIWKTFASPETPYRLYVLPSGLIRVLRPEESPDPSWPRISSIPADALLRIAKDFISELPESHQTLLSKTLDQERWWFPYFELLSTLGLRSRWIPYRRQRIEEEFERAISKCGPAPVVTEEKPMEPIRPPGVEKPNSLLRHVAASAVLRMTDVELRALNLPLGYVIDALTAK